MKVSIAYKTQIGLGFAIWERGAEVFLPYLMIYFWYKPNRVIGWLIGHKGGI